LSKAPLKSTKMPSTYFAGLAWILLFTCIQASSTQRPWRKTELPPAVFRKNFSHTIYHDGLKHFSENRKQANPAVRRWLTPVLVGSLKQSHHTWAFPLCREVPRPDAAWIQRRQMVRYNAPHSLANRPVDTVHGRRAFALQQRHKHQLLRHSGAVGFPPRRQSVRQTPQLGKSCGGALAIDAEAPNLRPSLEGGQCRWNRTPNPSCCPLLWDLTDRKHYHNGPNSQHSWSAGGDPLKNPSAKDMGHRSISDELSIEDSPPPDTWQLKRRCRTRRLL